MLGTRGEFEGVADWLPVLPMWARRMLTKPEVALNFRVIPTNGAALC